ncbi:hypothetical protein AAG570_000002 [Ranatra chinensis]|uniref:Peptidase S54 rhomboid domain-containing protein n=1 Tax=Ranatra chinensis TaxID=642074 RepID=A0ABD0YVT9_9HEMI
MQRRQRRDRNLQLGVLLLFNEICHLGLNNIPPVTLATVVSQALLYMGFIDVPWSKWDVCISGTKILKEGDYKTLFLSVIEHGDDMHLYYNMISFLIKGRTLEKKYGSINFALLLVVLTVMTSLWYVALSVAGAKLFTDPSILNSCAIGFSGVIFALKLITTLENSDGYGYVQGFRVPTQYTAWAELIAIHLLVPNASFIGHLAGILAGLIYMKSPMGSLIDSFIHSLTGKVV